MAGKQTDERALPSGAAPQGQANADLRGGDGLSLAILDALSAQIAVLDHDGAIVTVNQSWQRFAAENGNESCWPIPAASCGINYLAACRAAAGPSSASALQAHDGIKAVLSGQMPSFTLEYRHDAGQRARWLRMGVTPLAGGAVVAHAEFTERKQAEETVRRQKEFFYLIAENLGDFIAVIDLDGRRVYNSPSYARLFGSERDLRGSDAFAELHPDDSERVREVFHDTIRTGVGRQIQYRMLLADGTVREMESVGNVIRDDQGRITQVIVVARDVTERHRMEEQLRQLAFHDALTQLPNRRLLSDRLSQVMAGSARNGCHAALMFLDLDNFKLLNDTHGHQYGDLLLIEAADRLKRCVRETDTVARIGGDEYVVVVSELNAAYAESLALAEAVGEKIRAALLEPFLLTIEQPPAAPIVVAHQCTASIGIVVFVGHQATEHDILQWADRAMYEAKAAGRNRIRFHGTLN